jgi:hypothetical protein
MPTETTVVEEFSKGPNAKKDYTFDLTGWLDEVGETISSVAWTVPGGITNVSTANTTKTATIFLSGGTDGQSYKITCKVTTATRIEEKSIVVHIRA